VRATRHGVRGIQCEIVCECVGVGRVILDLNFVLLTVKHVPMTCSWCVREFSTVPARELGQGSYAWRVSRYVGIRPGLPGLTDPGSRDVPLGCADSDCKTLLNECVCGLCAG
jgi:hypothetical protein